MIFVGTTRIRITLSNKGGQSKLTILIQMHLSWPKHTLLLSTWSSYTNTLKSWKPTNWIEINLENKGIMDKKGWSIGEQCCLGKEMKKMLQKFRVLFLRLFRN